MTIVPGMVISPAISATLTQLVASITAGTDAVLVGPSGCGLSTVAQLVSSELEKRAIPSVKMDCLDVKPWQEAYRQACQTTNEIKGKTGLCPALVIDNFEDMESSEVREAHEEVTRASSAKFHARLWVMSLDCRCPEVEDALPMIRDPQVLVIVPEYYRDDLLRIYPVIGRGQRCEWGEAILYFVHDWCGTDLALVKGMSTYFYGEWRDRLYDESVVECLDRWLIADQAIDKYRRTLDRMSGKARDYIRLLCSGGKVPCHAFAIEHESDSALRGLFFSGFITKNLIPGFYQFRNLTVKLLAMREHVRIDITSASLLRSSSNARINVLLQDTELSLRHLLTSCFREMGIDAVRRKLQATRTAESPMAPELRKSLTDWAQKTGSDDLHEKVMKHLTEYTINFHRTHSIWTRVCGMHSSAIGGMDVAIIEPKVESIAEYLTFNELSDLIQSFCPIVFPNWCKAIPGRQPPAKSWGSHLARLRRIRNMSAHLRNVSFQDMEDLLTTTREMRRDIKDNV